MSTPYYLYSIKDVTTTQNYVTCPNSQNEKKKKQVSSCQMFFSFYCTSGSHTVLFPGPFTLLKTIKDPKEILSGLSQSLL